ncbi:MAG: type transport system permease protein [Baekduia sp.]|jgi:ABC-2 type transport system permease protein|nr:transporter permease [Conexibacter sp.]MDX6716345.1 type transport system permease protein [Baekduia sp.]MDX6732321.1 type transport system permease protein [Baekduia sp.]
MRSNLEVVRALVVRALNEITRVPGAALPGVLAPTIFLVGLSGVFGEAARLPGFDATDFRTFIVPVGLLQGASFTGAATGVNLARDIERGWFDRLMVCPAPRTTILLGIVASAALRALLPATFLLLVAFALGVAFPGVGALALDVVLVMGLATAVAFYAVLVALRFRTQQAAPLMQTAGFVAVLFTTAYAPKELLSGWLRAIATVNPVTFVLEGVRQGFTGSVTWADTWPALLAVAGLLAALGSLAVRRLGRVGV